MNERVEDTVESKDHLTKSISTCESLLEFIKSNYLNSYFSLFVTADPIPIVFFIVEYVQGKRLEHTSEQIEHFIDDSLQLNLLSVTQSLRRCLVITGVSVA